MKLYNTLISPRNMDDYRRLVQEFGYRRLVQNCLAPQRPILDDIDFRLEKFRHRRKAAILRAAQEVAK